MPEAFPTHRLDGEFWEALGRAVAAFGFLEEVLAKAIYQVTGRQPVVGDQEQALAVWQKQLEAALTGTLRPLADQFQRAVTAHGGLGTEHAIRLAEDIKAVAAVRDALCHGSWHHIGPNSAKPLFVDRKLQVFENVLDAEFLNQTRRHAADLACDAMDIVSALGIAWDSDE